MNLNQPSHKQDRLFDVIWLLLLIGVTSVWCWTAARALSATFDEPTYLECGLKHWHTGSYKPLMRLGTMPLPIDAQTLPLYLWERWHGTRIDLNHDIAWVLPLARTATLPFWWLLLVCVFYAARSLGGPWAGRLASALAAFEPGLLGHAALATTDIAVTACLMAFVCAFRAGRGRGWWRSLGAPSLLYGAAILAKASALVFAPLFMLVIEFDRLWRSDDFAKIESGNWRARFVFLRDGLLRFRRDFFRIIGLGLLVTFLYCGSDWSTEPTFVKWAQGLQPGKMQTTMLWVSEHLKIFTNAGEGLAQQVKHNMRADSTYLLGQAHKRAVWYYFPVALSIKSSIPFLLLPLLVLFVRRRALWNWACLAALALLFYSVTCRVQIGIRFMFPLMALAAVGLGAALAQVLGAMENRGKRAALSVLIAAGIVGNAGAVLAVWPDAICYTNAFWGGTRTGYRLLSDSNYDWGQGLPELLDWRAKHHVEEIDVWYFGLDPRANVFPLHKIAIQDEAVPPGGSLEDVLRGKCVAVSTTLLYGPYFTKSPSGQAAASFFRQRTPMDRTTTYFIYDFRSF